MKTLLNNRFAPVTHSWGFLDLPYDTARRGFKGWLGSLDPAWKWEEYQDGLKDCLQHLEPLNHAPYAILATDSRWTAVFKGDFSGPHSAIAHLSKRLCCRGLVVSLVEDAYDETSNRGTWGSTQLCTFKPESDGLLNDDRSIYAVNNCGKWEFGTDGPPLPFEEIERYTARRIKDRFDGEMLERYCHQMNIRLLDVSFYGPQATVMRMGLDCDPPETFESIQARLRMHRRSPD